MKPVFLLLLSLSLTGCLKANIAPTSSKGNGTVIKADSIKTTTNSIKADTVNAFDWYNGTKGIAVIQVTCSDCTAIATVGDVSTPFLFNDQGVGQLKYTPKPGLLVYIAVCPGSVKAIKANIFDSANTSLYAYSGVNGNWNSTYVIK